MGKKTKRVRFCAGNFSRATRATTTTTTTTKFSTTRMMIDAYRYQPNVFLLPTLLQSQSLDQFQSLESYALFLTPKNSTPLRIDSCLLLGCQNKSQWDHIPFTILFISADLLESGSSIALSVSTCLMRHIDLLTFGMRSGLGNCMF